MIYPLRYEMRKMERDDLFFKIRDEIIDSMDDTNDHLTDESGCMMDHAVIGRLENALKLMEDLRQSLSIPDREYVADE